MAQFSLYVHKSGLKPDSFHFRGVIFLLMCYAIHLFHFHKIFSIMPLSWLSTCLSLFAIWKKIRKFSNAQKG